MITIKNNIHNTEYVTTDVNVAENSASADHKNTIGGE